MMIHSREPSNKRLFQVGTLCFCLSRRLDFCQNQKTVETADPRGAARGALEAAPGLHPGRYYDSLELALAGAARQGGGRERPGNAERGGIGQKKPAGVRRVSKIGECRPYCGIVEEKSWSFFSGASGVDSCSLTRAMNASVELRCWFSLALAAAFGGITTV